MANLIHRDNVFQDLFDFRRDFDQMFNRLLTGRRGHDQSDENALTTFSPAVDAYIDRTGKRFVCRVALPGVDPKDVTIEAHGGMLSLRGERKISNERREADFVHTEFMYGSFVRDIELPEGVDADKLTAEYNNGVLEITAPISAAALPRRIEIKAGEQNVKQMGASASGR